MKKITFLTAAFILFVLSAIAQDVHFTQFYNHTVWTNPALAAHNNQINGALIYRNQWSAITKAFSTVSGSFDLPVYRPDSNTVLGGGLLITTDRAGSAGYKENMGKLVLSLHRKIGNQLTLSGGFAAGLLGRSLNTADMLFADQIDPTKGFVNPTSEQITNPSYRVFDADAGINAGYIFNAKTSANAGVSYFHIITGKKSFNGTVAIPSRLVMHGKLSYAISQVLKAEPAVLFMQQANINQLNAAVNIIYGNAKKGLIAGGAYRMNDAAILQAGVLYNGLRLMVSYDINGGALKNNAGFASATEVYAGYSMPLPAKKVREEKPVQKVTEPIWLKSTGLVVDEITGAGIVPDVLYLMEKQEGGNFFTIDSMVNAPTPYLFSVKPCTIYKISARKQGYLNNSLLFASDCENKMRVIENEALKLTSIEKDKVYKLSNIYYEFNSSALTMESRTELDVLYTLLTENPELVIELRSHTDSIGNDDYNLKLSQERAESCVHYLLEKGVSANRLFAKGYGERQPVAPNTLPDGSDNMEGRALNRRTEFAILGKLKNGTIEFNK